MTIDQLQSGQQGIITKVNCSDDWIQRLMVLGLVEGARVEYVGAAIGGDPIEIKLFGAPMSIQRKHAGKFFVNEIQN
ncbi:hypothetical protein LCGC14_2510360 [marine sediment metagenome]|uniref:Ferrous iron transporter FeoA-like domain-containing protein n=1 Tax=marine sediment metagenome TaxID=412755 RepID=A0A0F9AZA7_9ZZZZ